jgi:RND family efflux transporter MFP subunit
MAWIGWSAALCALIAVGLAAYRHGHAAGQHGRTLDPRMRKAIIASAAAACLLGAFFFGYAIAPKSANNSTSSGGTDSPAGSSLGAVSAAPVVPVQTVPIRQGTIRETITAYGRVVAQPGETRVFSLPFQATVERTLVTAGQQVTAGTPLIALSPSPAARAQLLQAEQSARSTRQELQQTRQEYQQHLAVNTQLAHAEQAYRSARLLLERLQKEGAGASTTMTASVPGIVSHIDVREGQMVAAGAPLLEVAHGNRIEVELGFEPEDIPSIHVGDPVELAPVHGDPGQGASGRVRLITSEVDPATALVKVFVSLPSQGGVTLFSFMRGTLTAEAGSALIVPTEAVLPEKNGYTLFTVRNGHAVRHLVRVGLETDTEVQVEGRGVAAGESAVLAGNYELKPGMAVSPQASR